MVILGLYLQRFAEFLLGEEGKAWLDQAKAKKDLFGGLLGQSAIDGLSEDGVRKIFENLEGVPSHQSIQMAQHLLSVYGLEGLREHLKYFMYGVDPLEDRFEQVRRGVPELPSEALMELATFAVPRDFCIWDENAKRTVRFVGQSRMHGLSEHAFSGEISGMDYVSCKVALNHLREQVRAYQQRKVDFVDAYLFVRYMSKQVMTRLSA